MFPRHLPLGHRSEQVDKLLLLFITLNISLEVGLVSNTSLQFWFWIIGLGEKVVDDLLGDTQVSLNPIIIIVRLKVSPKRFTSFFNSIKEACESFGRNFQPDDDDDRIKWNLSRLVVFSKIDDRIDFAASVSLASMDGPWWGGDGSWSPRLWFWLVCCICRRFPLEDIIMRIRWTGSCATCAWSESKARVSPSRGWQDAWGRTFWISLPVYLCHVYFFSKASELPYTSFCLGRVHVSWRDSARFGVFGSLGHLYLPSPASPPKSAPNSLLKSVASPMPIPPKFTGELRLPHQPSSSLNGNMSWEIQCN